MGRADEGRPAGARPIAHGRQLPCHGPIADGDRANRLRQWSLRLEGRNRALTLAATDALMADVDVTLLADEEIYGGKLVAAMDRQHPRDLFDVKELFEHGGITPGIRRAFVVYLASHNRTLHEVLFPSPKDIRLAYEGGFAGMTTKPVTLDSLLATRERLFGALPAALDANEREFLRTLVGRTNGRHPKLQSTASSRRGYCLMIQSQGREGWPVNL